MLDLYSPGRPLAPEPTGTSPKSALAETTGISKSTLSSLELLLPIAQAHQLPLDELVGASEVGDPRIRNGCEPADIVTV